MNKKLHFIFLLLLAHVAIIGQTTYTISDPEELEDLELVAGDEVILEDGTYSSDDRIKFTGNGTSDLPITFRPASPGGVIFNNGLKMSIAGDYLVVDGFHWKGGYGASNFIEFRSGSLYANHSTIQNCAIDGLGVEDDELQEGLLPDDPEDRPSVVKHRWVVLYGTYNNVINCSFMNKSSAGVMVLAEYEFNASPPFDEDAGETGENTRCLEVGHTISNNYFYKFEKITEIYAEYQTSDDPLSNSGDSETIRVGTSEYQNVNSNVVVSNNYFVEADGENEIITNKSKGNTYINNTFRRCRGSLVLRHGSDALVDGNVFLGENVEGTGGIRIVDSNHTITNNYIQDCITVVNQAIWNNGITFMGGGDSSAVVCTSTNVSNGYQKSENITLSNNTIVNTNAPLFYNTDRGTNDVTGIVSNNLIYFDTDSINLTNVISGNVDNAYSDFGTKLVYNGNVYKGTSLGEEVIGFTEEEEITSVADGEIFKIDGAGDKGADLGIYEPITDDMVGDGIGACFLDYLGGTIANPSCTIEIAESLTANGITTFSYEESSSDISINANVSWTVVSSDDWITFDIDSGTTSETVVVTVTENEDETSERRGSITFSQVDGDIVRVLNVSQEAAPLPDPRLDYTLINDNTDTDNVVVDFVFHEEITETKNNIAINSLDKDFDTQWSGMNVDDVPGEIIYDLGGVFNLALVDFASTSGKRYEFQIFVSTTGTEESDFVNAFTEDVNLVSNTTGEFKSFELPSVANNVKYVKIVGYGQPLRPSPWNTITEIEFYGAASINDDSVEENSGEFCDSEEYDNAKVYGESGTTVIYNGTAYENQWYTLGQLPTNDNGPWEVVGFCGTEASDCSSIPVWSSKLAYGNVGSQVVYNQNIYENKWYIQGGVPGEDNAWELFGFCDTAKEENSGELCDSEEYDSETIYAESGIPVIYNGTAYENQWYTKGQLPTDGGPWKLIGFCNANLLVQIYSLSGLLITEYTTSDEPEELNLESGIYIITTTNTDNGTTSVEKISF